LLRALQAALDVTISRRRKALAPLELARVVGAAKSQLRPFTIEPRSLHWLNRSRTVSPPLFPRKGASKAGDLDPLKLAPELQTALYSLYSHYRQTFERWAPIIPVPPVFIVVCSNTAVSKLVYEWISGFQRKNEDGEFYSVHKGHLELFRNFDEYARAPEMLNRARAAVNSAGAEALELSDRSDDPGERVSIGTMHVAKGLEFKAVAVMACDEDALPLRSRIDAAADEAELEDVYDTERQLLYVAATRARDRLLVTGVKPGSEFLKDISA
jgi:superfamily I DNA/RNA helicase